MSETSRVESNEGKWNRGHSANCKQPIDRSIDRSAGPDRQGTETQTFILSVLTSTLGMNEGDWSQQESKKH
jgi:hypothetical protein